jgi:hypothetical protein
MGPTEWASLFFLTWLISSGLKIDATGTFKALIFNPPNYTVPIPVNRDLAYVTVRDYIVVVLVLEMYNKEEELSRLPDESQ